MRPQLPSSCVSLLVSVLTACGNAPSGGGSDVSPANEGAQDGSPGTPSAPEVPVVGGNPAPIVPAPGAPVPGTPPPAKGANRLEIVMGTGQAATDGWPFSDPGVVQLSDDQGRPVSGAPIQFSIEDNSDAIRWISAQTTTDPQGKASFLSGAGYVPANVDSVRVTVVARVSNDASVSAKTFVFRSLPSNNRAVLTPFTRVLAPDLEPIQMRSGSTLKDAIVLQFAYGAGPGSGRGVPDVAFTAAIDEANMGEGITQIPTASCVGRFAFSDATGSAACELKVTGVPGRYPLLIRAYGGLEYRNLSLQIVP